SFGDSSKRDLSVVLHSIFLLPQQQGEPILGVAWSMSFEIFVYFLFSLLILHRGLGWSVFAGWVVLLCVRPWSTQYPFTFFEHEYNFRILAGLAAAEVTYRCQLPRPGLVALVGMSMFVATAMLEVYTYLLGAAVCSVGFTVGSGLLVAGLAAWEKLREVRVPH